MPAAILPGRCRGRPTRANARQFRNSAAAKTEDLGTQVIQGVSAQGKRITRTIPAGKEGNEKEIDIVTETWYSPDLQVVVMSKTSDPRFGDSLYQLNAITRTEPDPALFAVPSDYTVKEGRPFQRGRRGAIAAILTVSCAPLFFPQFWFYRAFGCQAGPQRSTQLSIHFPPCMSFARWCFPRIANE